MKFGKLRPEKPLEFSLGSSKKVSWICDCGKKKDIKISHVTSGSTKTCGKCSLLETNYWKNSKFGKLRMEFPSPSHPKSNKKVSWVCDCGRKNETSVIHVTSGHTKTCGKCNDLSIEYLSSSKFGKLRMKNPSVISSGSNKKVEWVCDCGGEVKRSPVLVLKSKDASCGKCNLMSSEYLSNHKFGKLRMKDPVPTLHGSGKKVSWVCDCGNNSIAKVSYVTSGTTKTCGKCNLPKVSFWKDTKFGKLRMKNPGEFYKNSHKKTSWVCDCGGEVEAIIANVVLGNTSSCGKCFDKALAWYSNNEDKIRSLKTPINPEDIPPGLMTFSSPILKKHVPFEAKCGLCGKTYKPRWDGIRLGESISCGCSSFVSSKPQCEISDFIQSSGFESEIEYEVGGYKFDIFVPSSKLLVEYHGLIWHSNELSKKLDAKKYDVSKKNGYDLIVIYEDEWKPKTKNKTKSIILNRLENYASYMRPNKCRIEKIESKKADPFYEENHYIGKCRSKINYGVYFDDSLIACMSFKRPTRQSNYDWELVRMASVSEVRVYGIWSKLLKKFIAEFSPKSIVSFSDNRLFGGGVYGKIGFRFDGEIKPDYYWARGGKRFHKSSLRKTKEEKLLGKTESELRTAQGYTKIWDLGKKRWVALIEAKV